MLSIIICKEVDLLMCTLFLTRLCLDRTITLYLDINGCSHLVLNNGSFSFFFLVFLFFFFKIVPGYYLRMSTDGHIEHSTCMNNTASEHFMVERLIIDDLLGWAVDYKVIVYQASLFLLIVSPRRLLSNSIKCLFPIYNWSGRLSFRLWQFLSG